MHETCKSTEELPEPTAKIPDAPPNTPGPSEENLSVQSATETPPNLAYNPERPGMSEVTFSSQDKDSRFLKNKAAHYILNGADIEYSACIRDWRNQQRIHLKVLWPPVGYERWNALQRESVSSMMAWVYASEHDDPPTCLAEALLLYPEFVLPGSDLRTDIGENIRESHNLTINKASDMILSTSYHLRRRVKLYSYSQTLRDNRELLKVPPLMDLLESNSVPSVDLEMPSKDCCLESQVE